MGANCGLFVASDLTEIRRKVLIQGEKKSIGLIKLKELRPNTVRPI